MPDLFKFFISDLLEKLDNREIILAIDFVSGRDIVREQLSEEQVQSLHVAHYSILQDHTKELAQRKHLCLTSLVVLERQLLLGIFFSKGDGKDELPLDLHQFVDQVDLAARVQSWPLEESLVDHLKDGIAHRLQLASVESVGDDLTSWLVRRVLALRPDERLAEHVTDQLFRVVALSEHAVVLLEEVLHIVRVRDDEHEAMWPEHTDAGRNLVVKLIVHEFDDVWSVGFCFASPG